MTSHSSLLPHHLYLLLLHLLRSLYYPIQAAVTTREDDPSDVFLVASVMADQRMDKHLVKDNRFLTKAEVEANAAKKKREVGFGNTPRLLHPMRWYLSISSFSFCLLPMLLIPLPSLLAPLLSPSLNHL